jgi:gamma-glutamylaminecyclotransferase
MKAINPSEPARATNRAIVMAAADGSSDSDLRQSQLVFVYGTLKRGQPNHHLLAGSAFCGAAQLAGLALYDLGPFPMAIDCEGATLHGELFAVNDRQLAVLDRFEGAPRLYQRHSHQLNDGRAVWVYVGRPRQVRHVPRISSGVWPGP